MPVQLSIKKPGSLLSRIFSKEITDEEADIVMRFLTNPELVIVHRNQVLPAVSAGQAQRLLESLAPQQPKDDNGIGFRPPAR